MAELPRDYRERVLAILVKTDPQNPVWPENLQRLQSGD